MKFSILAALFAASAVSAHGTMSKFVANGKSYDGPGPGQSTGDSPIRAISGVEPVNDVNSQFMTCGVNSRPGGGVAEVSAGSDVEFQMRNGEGGTWVHIKGPITTSVFKCDGDASQCDPGSEKGWAVISHNGKEGDDWAMAKYGRSENVKAHIPKNLPSGDYVLRHELWADHNGNEFYIQCVNIRVTGGPKGSLADTGADLTSYPGAYSGSEPAFSWNPFGTDPAGFPFAGPAPMEEKDAPAAPESDPEPIPEEPTTPTTPTTPGSCAARRKAKRAGTAAAAAARRQESIVSRRSTSRSRRA